MKEQFTSNERTQQLRYPDAWGDTALLKRNAKWAADELDRQRAEIERLTRERDEARSASVPGSAAVFAAVEAERDRLMRLLEIERGVVLTRGQALARALRCFDELLDNVWPNGLPSTVDAVVEQMRHALENEKYSSNETTAELGRAVANGRDAERYRWLVGDCGASILWAYFSVYDVKDWRDVKPALDKAIDAQMHACAQKAEGDCRCVREDGSVRFNINCTVHGKAP